MITQYALFSSTNIFEAKFCFLLRGGLALCHQNSMQLFALFNVLVISLAEMKLVSLLSELSCWCVCRTVQAEEWLIEGPSSGGLKCV